MEIMQYAFGLMLIMLSATGLVCGAVYVIKRQKSLPAFIDERPLEIRNPELGKVFRKRRGA